VKECHPLWLHILATNILGILKGNLWMQRQTYLFLKIEHIVLEEWDSCQRITKWTISWRHITNICWLYIRWNITFQSFTIQISVSTILIRIIQLRYCGTKQWHTHSKIFRYSFFIYTAHLLFSCKGRGGCICLAPHYQPERENRREVAFSKSQ
jgi:hypothetical protein